MNLNHLRRFFSLLTVMSIGFALTGCTLFDGFGRSKKVEPTPRPQFTISITDQKMVSQSYQLDYVEGENLYEVFNRFTTINPEIYIQFEIRDTLDDIEFYVTSINGYNPNTDGKRWTISINSIENNNPLNLIRTKPNDQITIDIR